MMQVFPEFGINLLFSFGITKTVYFKPPSVVALHRASVHRAWQWCQFEFGTNYQKVRSRI
jgi:hypothetical protein